MFEQDAPVVPEIGFDELAMHGIKSFLVSSNSSAGKESRILFRFDGKFYCQGECYDVSMKYSRGGYGSTQPAGPRHDYSRVLEILLGVLNILLITYGIRSLYLTAKKLSATADAATGAQPQLPVRLGLEAPAGVPGPLLEWPLL